MPFCKDHQHAYIKVCAYCHNEARQHAESHPVLFKCMNFLESDSAGNTSKALRSYRMAYVQYKAAGQLADLDAAEAWLATGHDDEDLDTICTGEDISSGESEGLVMTDGMEVYVVPADVSKVLNDLFEATGL
jgi:hypothetical protein